MGAALINVMEYLPVAEVPHHVDERNRRPRVLERFRTRPPDGRPVVEENGEGIAEAKPVHHVHEVATARGFIGGQPVYEHHVPTEGPEAEQVL